MPTAIPAPSQAYVDALKVLDIYKTEGVTRAESDDFIKGAINELLHLSYMSKTDAFLQDSTRSSSIWLA